jgi:hypothetical protein
MGNTCHITDVVDHFYVMAGKVWDDARVGEIRLRLLFTDGRTLEGVPSSVAAAIGVPSDALDESGYMRHVQLEDQLVDLVDVQEMTIVRPSEPS